LPSSLTVLFLLSVSSFTTISTIFIHNTPLNHEHMVSLDRSMDRQWVRGLMNFFFSPFFSFSHCIVKSREAGAKLDSVFIKVEHFYRSHQVQWMEVAQWLWISSRIAVVFILPFFFLFLLLLLHIVVLHWNAIAMKHVQLM
jgi:hypothetical protein